MNKFTATAALATALALGLVAPRTARANAMTTSTTATTPSSMIEGLTPQTMTAAQFNSLFQPIDGVPTSNSTYQFVGSPVAGSIQSQVFQGTGAAAGLYAYAYSVGINPVADGTGEPVHLDGVSFQFNGFPIHADLTGSGTATAAYAIKDGSVGGITKPVATGGVVPMPASLTFQSGSTIGTLRAQFVDPSTQTPALSGSADSAIFVVLTDKKTPAPQYVNVGSSLPTTGNFATVYGPSGTLSPKPVPEPATVLAWSGVVAALGLVHLRRRASALSVA